MTLFQQFADVADGAGSHDAVLEVETGRKASFRDLLREASLRAERLASVGVRPGDRVGVELDNRLGGVCSMLAIWRCGAVAVPLAPTQSSRERKLFLEHSGAALELEVDSGELAAGGAPRRETRAAEVDPNDAALILYTSGTTGAPKGVELSHANLRTSAERIGARYDFGPATRFLGILPLFHGHGLVVTCLAPLLAGGTVVLDRPFDAFAADRFWKSVDRFGITVFSSVPPVLRLLAQLTEPREPRSESPFRFGLCASAPLPEALRSAFEERFSCRVGNSYGMTETASWCAYGAPEPDRRREGSVGSPTAGTIRILDPPPGTVSEGSVGEIAISGPCVMKGYYRDARATADVFEGEWFRTGDLGFIEGGELFLSGRLRDVINRGGATVFPDEVDRLLRDHPGVTDAATVAWPSEAEGEIPVSFVVLDPGAGVPLSELKQYLRRELVPYKVPAELIELDQLPVGATGKIDKKALRGRER